MDGPAEDAAAFEARLAALKSRMEAGLGQRAKELRLGIAGLAQADPDARTQLGHQAHRLRGIAGTYGHHELTAQAAIVESAVRGDSQDPEVIREAELLASMVEEVSRRVGAAEGDSPPSSESAVSVPPAARLDEETSDSLRVLIIDDDAFVRRLLGRIFSELSDFCVTIVASAREGLSALKPGAFDIVLTDAVMPEMNGRAFYTAVRELGGPFATLPVLILSAATAEELGWESVLDEYTGWICKPFPPDELVSRVVALVEHARGQT